MTRNRWSRGVLALTVGAALTGSMLSGMPASSAASEPPGAAPSAAPTTRVAAAVASATQGTVKGIVTDDAGKPVESVKVTIGLAGTFTDPTGAFELPVDPGTYDATFEAYGYVKATVKGLVVTEGQTTTKNVSMTKLATATLSGTVKDGSGHGWPVYSKVTVTGTTGVTYTDPFTGRYTVDVPVGSTYKVHVDPVLPGYVTSDTSVEVTGDRTVNVGLKVNELTVRAPGYAATNSGTSQPFDSASPPAGWTVKDNAGTGGWAFNDPGQRGNVTGGEGNFAVIEGTLDGEERDTTLTAPATDLSGSSNPVISFNSANSGGEGARAWVEYSVDGGTTWDRAWQHTGLPNGRTEAKLPKAAGKSDVQVRFRFQAGFARFWEIDNVVIGQGGLQKIPGGIVAGHVTDAAKKPVNSATVTNKADASERVRTAATPDDAKVADGFYWMFNKGSGARTYDVTKTYSGSASVKADLKADSVTRANVALKAGQVTASTTAINKTVDWKGTATATVKLTNNGAAPATVTVNEASGVPQALAKPGAKLKRVKVASDPKRSLVDAAKSSKARPVVPADTNPSDPTWESSADLPVRLVANISGVHDGVLYTALGYDGSWDIADLYAYDSVAGTWSKKASAQHAREGVAHGWIDGRWYVTGGQEPFSDADPLTEVYNPKTDAWSQVADNPMPSFAAGSATVGGKLYVVGGCFDRRPCFGTESQVYDPATDAWSPIANYPEPVGHQSCGAIAGALYCAGGTNDDGGITSAYKYVPGAKSWEKLPDLPQPMWGGYTAVANGMLLISGGNSDGSITNEGFAFNPAKNAWTALPNANSTIYRGGGAPGFYRVGGIDDGLYPFKTVDVLKGFDQPSGETNVSWLSTDVSKVTLAPGQSKNITVTLNADVPEITQPGTFTAALSLRSDTATPVAPVAVTLTVKNPKTWGQVAGTVTDAAGAPVPGATVQIDSWATDYTLKTDKTGKYALWLDTRNNPLTLIAAKDGYKPTTAKVTLTKGTTVTKNFVLKAE